MNLSPAIESTNQILNYLKNKRLAQLTIEDNELEGTNITLEGRETINFGSCSYLGLEFDTRLKLSAINAINNFGTQFSASRAYVSAKLYSELEGKLTSIFGGEVVVMPTTTLGHIATIPVIIGKNDAVIMDHQVHNSVQTAVKLVKSDGTHVELLRHNRMDILERRLTELSEKFESIWYLADGIYSMYGDKAPMKELEQLLNRYPKFHLYVDDAHAMSCFGENGKGFALSQIPHHDKMIVGTSLNKAFASGGSAFVFPSKEIANKVRNCGGPLITSGPMQPGALGAAIAAADIHLSDEIRQLQEDLQQNIKYCHLLLEKYNLPNLAEIDSPIFFVGVGLPKVGYNVVSKMKAQGFLVNIGIFPAVPMKNTGVRFTITRLHTFKQIEEMVRNLALAFKASLIEENYSLEEIYKAFKIKSARTQEIEKSINNIINDKELILESFETIIDVNKNAWDSTIGSRSGFDWNALNVLENSFKENTCPGENWDFHYVIIKNKLDEIVLSTFITTGIMKDDMLSSKELSFDIEKMRKSNPYYYCSKFIMIGSLATEGNHIFLNNNYKDHSVSLNLLFDKLQKIQSQNKATSIIIRDLDNYDDRMDDLMVDNGYFKAEMPESFSLDIKSWNPNENFLETLSKRSKKHFKQNVRRFENKFKINLISDVNREKLDALYQLYLNVHAKGLELNTFKLPFKFFETINLNKNWDIITLDLLPDEQNKLVESKTVGVVFAYKGISTYVGGMVGIDYEFNRQYGVYRQSIYQFIKAGKEAGFNKLDFGFCAGIEKKKFGAVGHKSCAYMQVKDNFKFESLMAGTFRKEVKGEVAQLD